MTSPMAYATVHQPLPTRRTWKGPRTIPASLTHLADERRFVLWRYGSEPNGKGKYPKVPYSPHKGDDGKYHHASMDNSESWGTWDECMAAAADWRTWFDGAGIVLCKGEIGIDLDDGIDQEQADQLIGMAQGRAYLERSVSGTGFHIIALGQMSEAIKTDTIELYPGGSGRYFCLGTELAGSSAPAPAQQVIDQAVTYTGGGRRASAPRASTSLRMAETVALTAELAAEIRDAESRLPDLLRELPGNMTPQLADLLYRGTFPAALKDTSASGARAVVVAQLHRAPKRRYTDAEIYVLSRTIWRRKGYEGAMAGSEKALDSDAWRLIATYRWNAPPKSGKRTYQDAPDPLVYLARLADERGGDLVPLNRDERANVTGCSRATAQRTEEKLVTAGLVELTTYALKGGLRGRRGAIRITPAGFAALSLANESVIQREKAPAAANDQVKPIAPARAKPAIPRTKNTFVCGDEPSAPTPPHKQACSSQHSAQIETGEKHARLERDQGHSPIQAGEARQQSGVDARHGRDRGPIDRQRLHADQSGKQFLRLHGGECGSVQGNPESEPTEGPRPLTTRERCELARCHVERRRADEPAILQAMAYAQDVLSGRIPPPDHLQPWRSEYSMADRRLDEAISVERWEAQAQPPPPKPAQDVMRFPRCDWPADIWE